MKRTLMTLFICLTLAVAAVQAQDKPAQAKAPDAKSTALPTADQIIDKYVQAIGGKAAVEKLNSRLEKGTFELAAMGLSAPFESYSKAPNKTVFTIDISGVGTIQRGYNGTVGWSSDPQTGLREMSGGELAQTKLGSDFYRDVKLKELYPKRTVKGVEKVGDRDAYVVEATSADGITETMYFDTQSGLLVRTDADAESPQGKQHVTALISDYREVDGVKIPFTLVQKTPQFEITIKLDTVKHNVPVEDTKFNKPAAQ
ncbi:MAG TPA: hypothetical protein VKA60_11450 [Blastocatellia bacterium]|nr:hypothetical protein [Blastocatellia bacterium]